MKHLLNGVAIAAALAIAAPAWAQAPMTPSTPAKPAAAAPTAPKQAHHRPMRHHMAKGGKMRKMAAGDQMTEQLNREELARIQGGAPAAAPASAANPYKKGQ